MSVDCEDCNDKNNEIEYLLEILQLVYNNASKGINGVTDYGSVCRNIINLVSDCVKDDYDF